MISMHRISHGAPSYTGALHLVLHDGSRGCKLILGLKNGGGGALSYSSSISFYEQLYKFTKHNYKLRCCDVSCIFS